MHGGQTMPVGALLGWCAAAGPSFPHWDWSIKILEVLPDGRVKVGSLQKTRKLCSDLPAIGSFPEVKLSEVPPDSLLLTDEGAVLPVEIGYYTFDAKYNKATKIEYTGELGETEGSNTMSYTPNVGPPLLYALAGKPLPPPPSE